MAGPIMREALNEAEPRAMADERSRLLTMAFTADMRAGWPSDSAQPRHMVKTSSEMTLMCPLKINAASPSVSVIAMIWLRRMMRMKPKRSANAPDKIDISTVGIRSAKAITPSQPGEWVSSHASQPTAVRYIQRPTDASVWPTQYLRKTGIFSARLAPPKT